MCPVPRCVLEKGEGCEVPRVDLQGSELVEQCEAVRTGVLDERRYISLGSLSLTQSQSCVSVGSCRRKLSEPFAEG